MVMRTNVVSILLFLSSAMVRADDADQLKSEIARLKQQVKALGEIIEGTAGPVNLGRTSIASVTASSVNGGRALDSIYYGVVNAFDDGSNVHNNINYTYWLTDGEIAPWLEVHFDHPVSVASIVVEGGGEFATRFKLVKGGEVNQPRSAEVKLPAPLHGVKSVRLTFAGTQQNTATGAVHEVRILGHVPPQVKYTVQRPRVLLDAGNAVLRAREALDEWRQALSRGLRHEVAENGNEVVVTFYRNELGLLRIVMNKKNSNVQVTPLADLAPLPR